MSLSHLLALCIAFHSATQRNAILSCILVTEHESQVVKIETKPQVLQLLAVTNVNYMHHKEVDTTPSVPERSSNLFFSEVTLTCYSLGNDSVLFLYKACLGG